MISLPAERTGHRALPDLAQRRAAMETARCAGAWTVSAPPEEIVLGGRRALRFKPQGAARARMLHMHGGAFRLGCPEIEGPFVRALADRCGVEIIVPAYRLAPEHPFPAGLNDALTVLRACPRDVPLILSGDSAGGGLAASVTLLALAEGVKLAGLVMLSPWLDLTVSAASYQANALNDPLFSQESAASGAVLYLQGQDPETPLASPLFADLTGFPPSLISVGTGEVLADDAAAMHQRLCAAGVASQLCMIDGMDHVAVVRGMALPGSAQTFAVVAAFVDGLC